MADKQEGGGGDGQTDRLTDRQEVDKHKDDDKTNCKRMKKNT